MYFLNFKYIYTYLFNIYAKYNFRFIIEMHIFLGLQENIELGRDFLILDQTNIWRVRMWIRHCHLCMANRLKSHFKFLWCKMSKSFFLLGFLWKILQKEWMIQFDEIQFSVFENWELKWKFDKCWSVKNVNIWGKRVLTDFQIDFPNLIKFTSNKLHRGDRNYTTRRRIEGTGTIQLGEG